MAALEFDTWMNLYAGEINKLVTTIQPLNEEDYIEALYLCHEEVIAPITSSSDSSSSQPDQ